MPHRAAGLAGAIILLATGLFSGCDRPVAPRASAGSSPTVASLVPAATDLIQGMGAGSHLVGVSSFDDDPGTAKLPRIGAYENIDWEKLGQLRPSVLVTQYGPNRAPEGFTQRAEAIGATPLNLRMDRLNDVYTALGQLGAACNEVPKAAACGARLRTQCEAVARRVAGRPRVRVLIVIDDAGASVIGRDTFLDDLLTIAGGENAEPATGYPAIDREELLARRPEVVLQLLPAATPQVLRQAQAAWASAPEIPAVKNGRIVVFTQGWMLRPGSHVGDIASEFAGAIHPEAAAAPAEPS